MNKEQWIIEGQRRRAALTRIAQKLGKDHPVTEMLGSLAWGRHNWEIGPKASLERVIELAGAMDGIYQTINLWARDHERKAQGIIISIYREVKS